jgi:hypothetical protein
MCHPYGTGARYAGRVYTGGPDDKERAAPASPAGSAASPADGGRHDQGSSGERPAPRHSAVAGESDPARYTLRDEPLPTDADVDWRYLYGLVLERTEREEDRGKTLDAKVTTLLGGVVAFIGFSFRVNASVWGAGAALLYFIPLVVLFDALLTKRGKRAPTAESLTKYFPAYPVSTLKEGVQAMLIADSTNEKINDRKAARVDLAAILTGVVTIIVLVTQFGLALESQNVRSTAVSAKPTVVVPAAANRAGASGSRQHGPNRP